VPRLTREYPTQGKLEEKPSATVEYAEGEPAEILKIAIVVGPDELASGILRNQFTSLRGQRHEALVYRWQDALTFDVIAFDLVDYDAPGGASRIDLLLLSDQIFGPTLRAQDVADIEKAALSARLKFPDVYLVGVSQDSEAKSDPKHPFATVERKAASKGLQVFDDKLFGLITQDGITGLLLGFARSDRYGPERSVWSVSPEDDIPLPVAKSELDPP
jgi:hypothetical protein